MSLKNTKWMGIIILLSLLMSGISFGERGYDLDELDDLELESLDRQKNKTTQRDDKGQRLILFDDNLYLLDDDFDFGEDELKLQTFICLTKNKLTTIIAKADKNIFFFTVAHS